MRKLWTISGSLAVCLLVLPVQSQSQGALPIAADLGLSQASPEDACDELRGQPIHVGIGWSQVWLALDQEASCTDNCHNGTTPAAELDLSSLMLSIYFLVNQQSSRKPDALRVVPGDPRASWFFQKVNCAKLEVGRQMPPGGHLPLHLQGMIYDWIEQGAYGENAEDPIPRDFLYRATMESIRR